MKISLNFNLLLLMAFFQLPIKFACSETPTKEYTSYRRYPLCSPSDYMRYPVTTEDVVSIVKEAIARGVNVKPFGSRHSQTDIICTEGIPVDMTKLTSRKMNPDGVTATFGAGVLLHEVGDFLLQKGRALRTTPAFGGITLGGAIGTGAHGSTIKYNSSISAQVVKLTVVDGRGKVVKISNPTDLKAFKINLGLLGIVVDVTLDTVPLYKVSAHNYIESDDVLTNGVAVNWAKTTDQIYFHWFPALNEVVVGNLTFVSARTPGNGRTNLAFSTSDSFNMIATNAKNVAMRLTSSECAAASTLGYTILHVIEYLVELSLWTQAPLSEPIYTADGLSLINPAVGYPHKMFSSVCSEVSQSFLGGSCLWAHGNYNANITILDNEFNLALSDLELFVEDVKDIVTKTPTAFPLLGIILRFSDKSSDYMSTSYGREAVHIEFFLWNRKDRYNDASAGLAGYQTILQTLAKRYKARVHWAKSGNVYHSREMLDLKLDTEARSNFVAAMNKFDPDRIFLNNFGRRLLEIGTEIDIDPLTTRCALLDNCFCSLDSDCADGQTCTSLPGYDGYPVCETNNVVAAKESVKSMLPPPLGIINYLVIDVPLLVAAVVGECTVPKVVDTVTGVVGSLFG